MKATTPGMAVPGRGVVIDHQEIESYSLVLIVRTDQLFSNSSRYIICKWWRDDEEPETFPVDSDPTFEGIYAKWVHLIRHH